MLHLEIARAEAEAEFYKKAAQHAEAALKLDVPLDARGERPLDVPLLQMRTKLALKTDIYRDAETPEEKAMLLLEQAPHTAPQHAASPHMPPPPPPPPPTPPPHVPILTPARARARAPHPSSPPAPRSPASAPAPGAKRQAAAAGTAPRLADADDDGRE